MILHTNVFTQVQYITVLHLSAIQMIITLIWCRLQILPISFITNLWVWFILIASVPTVLFFSLLHASIQLQWFICLNGHAGAMLGACYLPCERCRCVTCSYCFWIYTFLSEISPKTPKIWLFCDPHLLKIRWSLKVVHAYLGLWVHKCLQQHGIMHQWPCPTIWDTLLHTSIFIM